MTRALDAQSGARVKASGACAAGGAPTMKLRVWLCSECRRRVPPAWKPRRLDCEVQRAACAACDGPGYSMWRSCELVVLEPGAPATEGSEGGAQRLGKITSNVSVPTHAGGSSSAKR